MRFYVVDDAGNEREVKAVYKGSADGTPIKLEEGTSEFEAAVKLACNIGVLHES